ncbi:sugar phosphate isomerase/epimerase [Kribbella sandramycini]|uniref:Sugar phosphate isomerase/epimerase n=1 Tax=Kribbella sandramycini TaxID=60450 RepID=A0A7Y4NYT0_9ACTN|nr:sugar phosphate isomerase/epimerase [Kribbella sandramycini]MBB6565010.1 sugar phosphate isomerase/epimerase [Kribbella sandramycini]NOL41282.1 sugar phosphate isomerase/epimerase [Kribbella sandramycini]
MVAVDNLSLQLYTVRYKLEEDFDATLARIAEIGFTKVEPFGVPGAAEKLAEALPKHGLTAPTTHAGLLREDAAPIYAAAKQLGIGTVIEPYIDPARWTSADDVKATAEALNQASVEAAEHGITVGYHNHHFEFENKIDGVHALEIFVDHLNDDVILEVDTYWAVVGGADVPAILAKWGNRVQALHVKDGDGTLNNKAQVGVGNGEIAVRDILAAAPQALRVVELDDYEGEIFDAVEASFKFLTGEDAPA